MRDIGADDSERISSASLIRHAINYAVMCCINYVNRFQLRSALADHVRIIAAGEFFPDNKHWTYVRFEVSLL